MYLQSPDGFVFQSTNPEWHQECARLTIKGGKQAAKDQARKALLDILKPGDTVYTVLRHVSRSGMMRHIDLYAMSANGPVYLTGHAATLMDDSRAKDNSIKVGGCGMDMGFHLVYNLSYTLFPDGFGISGKMPLGHEIRPQTSDKAAKAITKGAQFHGRNGDTTGWDNDGGYALNHKWL